MFPCPRPWMWAALAQGWRYLALTEGLFVLPLARGADVAGLAAGLCGGPGTGREISSPSLETLVARHCAGASLFCRRTWNCDRPGRGLVFLS